MESEIIEESQIVLINSRQRLTGDDRYFSFALPLTREDFNYVSLLQFYMPKSYYLFDTGFNTFEVENGEDVSETWETVTITPGNYNANSLQSHLKLILNNNYVDH